MFVYFVKCVEIDLCDVSSVRIELFVCAVSDCTYGPVFQNFPLRPKDTTLCLSPTH